MKLSKEFWEAYKGLLVVTESDRLHFTSAGREHFSKKFAENGFSISNVKTIEDFRRVMGVVNARELEKNTQEMRRLLDDPTTTPAERALIKRVLSMTSDVEGECEESAPRKAQLRLVEQS